MPWRRLWQVGTLVAGVLLAVGAVTALHGSVALDNRLDPTSSWSKICRYRVPREDRRLLSRCARVSGRVVGVRREDDVHLFVLAHLHLFVIKLQQQATVPRWGTSVTVIGPLVRSRGGLREVQAWRLTAH